MYESEPLRLDMHSGAGLIKSDLGSTQVINLFYETTYVKHEFEIPVMSIWGLMSSIGGSLGLFLGFSCFSVVSAFIDRLQEI